MAVTIKIKPSEEDKKSAAVTVELNARKTLDGHLVIMDHFDIDIILLKGKKKVLAMAKSEMGDHIYDTQHRLFEYLRTKGVIQFESVQGGNVYGSMEAKLAEGKNPNSDIQATILAIAKFIEEERPFFMVTSAYKDLYTNRMATPSDEESTELGEVPHAEKKGTGDLARPYGASRLGYS